MANLTGGGITDVLGGQESFKVEHIVSIPVSKILGAVIVILGAGILFEIIKNSFK